MTRLNSHQLRDISEGEAVGHVATIVRRPLVFILEDIYDTYNIGGLFRLADALAVSRIYLCGTSETPPNHKIMKASVGTYKIVPWVYKQTAREAIADVRNLVDSSNQIPAIIAVEQSDRSIPYNESQYTLPCALVLGNESFGVKKETLDLCDHIVEIPMWGVNKSLNVIVSAAIVGYQVGSGLKK